MSKIPSYLYRKTEMAKNHHAMGFFEDVYLIKLLPNTQYRQTNAAGDVVFEITTEVTPNSVCSFVAQENGALHVSFFDVKHNVWWPVQYAESLFDLSKPRIEELEKRGFQIDRSSNHNLFLYDLEAMLTKRFGGKWEIFHSHVLKDGLLKIRHDLSVIGKFVEGTSSWDMGGQIHEFGNDVAEKLERFKLNNLPKIYADIRAGEMSLDQFVARFGG
ncbi:MAG: hypothetical protein VXW65_03915, partial [Pseudomonadota bacterium]|nr:hypothetical protein [Pseudomonadota bacterium]